MTENTAPGVDASYSTMSLEDAANFYRNEITIQMQADGYSPGTETPTYSWLNTNYPGFVKHLQRQHDMSPGDFYTEIGVPENPESPAYFDHIEDTETRTTIEDYLTELREKRGLADATVTTRRSILRLYTETYRDVHGDTDLLTPLYDAEQRSSEMDRAADVFEVLNRRDGVLTTLASQRKYVQEVREFYNHLVTFGNALYNPLSELEKRFGWGDTPSWDNPSLTRDDVKDLFSVADSPLERFLVVGVCGWGLRTSEVCGLHMSQLHLSPSDAADPYIEFGDERKNGPGSVSMLTGTDVLEDQIERVSSQDTWNGYLLPSPSSDSGHISSETARRHFKSLADRADVTVAGSLPVPKMGRRFWYTIYGDAVKAVAERFEVVAEEQGSKDETVVIDNYLSEAEERRHRRNEMHSELAGLFSDL